MKPTGRQLLSYVPANLLPALAAVAMVVIYTRLLTPAEFGRFNLAYSVVLIGQTVGFNALAFATTRFYPAALRDGTRDAFLRETFSGFALVSLVICMLALLAIAAFPNLAAWVGLVLPLVLLRSLVGQNQAINRAADGAWRFNLVECAHSLTGLGIGLAFLLFWARDGRSPLLGLLVAALLCAAFEWRLMRAGFGAGPRNAARAAALHRFALPLSLSFAASALLQYGDRFLIDGFIGPQAVGPYAVAWSLVERPTTLLSVAISLATFQGVVQALEHHGTEAARVQLGQNGIALLALVAPACVGLAVGAGPIAAILVGPQFRASVATLMPLMAATALLRCLSVHFVDHAFHLSRRSDLMLAVYGPMALATLALDAVLVPRLGAIGAAWSALVCQAAALGIGALLGRRAFPLSLPWADVARVGACTALMGGVLLLLRAPATMTGLATLIATGCAVYALGLLGTGLVTPRGLRAALRRQTEVPAA